VLFTDLTGSSALLQRLGDEGGEKLRRRHFGILREAVAETGGEEVKNLGDGLMVVFDSAVAASRCAISMQKAIERHNAAGGSQLGVRVGMHVGEPIRDEDDYFGSAVVVAKRLCDAAGSGQILVSSLVRGLVSPKSGFVFVPAGDIPLKGMDEPVSAFSVEWRDVTSAERRPALVGRQVPMERLEAELDEAAARRLRVVLVLGEAGVGKTRLTSELVDRHRDDAIALTARAYPLGATASLGLWVEALERRLRSFREADVLELCGGHVDDLAALLPSVSAAAKGQSGGDRPRIRLLSALASLLQRMSERSTLVVTLDDVHLADGSSWEALNYLSRNLVESRLLILLAARPEELAEHPVAGEVVRALEQEGLLTRVQVSPLARQDVKVLAEELVGGPVTDALVDWVVSRAEGSPLFATGLVRALIEEGSDLAHPSLHSLPEDLADRVQARLRALESGDRATLELLTVIGYRAELRDLLRLSSQPLDALAPVLERLQRVRLVAELEEDGELLYEISHPLIQEAIYSQISGARRRSLHRHAARVLVDAGRYGAAASHVVQAADPGDDEAIETLCEALRRAEAGEHHREALALLEALLKMIPAGDNRWGRVVDVMPLTPEWIVDHRADVDAEVGVQAMRRADQVLERSGDAAHRAAVKFRLGSLLVWGMADLEAGRVLVDTARQLFFEAGDERAGLLAANEMGYHQGIADDLTGHEAQARRMLEKAESVGDEFLRLQALCSLAWALAPSGRINESLEVIEEAIKVASETDRAYRLSYLMAMRGWLRAFLGERRAGEDLDLAREVNPAYRDTLLLDFATQVAWFTGDLTRSVGTAMDQIAWDGGVSPRRALGAGTAVAALAEMGRAEEAAELQATVDQPFRGRRWWSLSLLAAWSRTTIPSLSGDRRAGLELLSGVAEDGVASGYWLWTRWMLGDLAEAGVYARDYALALRAHDLLLADPAPPDGEPNEGLRAFVAGAASVASGQVGTAAQALETAATHFEVAGWRLYQGRALALLGHCLARVDRDRATDALERAAGLFEQCQAVVRRQEVLAALSGLGAKGRRKKTELVGPAALSKRELEVARLAAEGCSAREIAEQLYIGERTVETHLANAYTKLGVSSKLDLVRRAAALGILASD
jgi:class 3 adenylate cyclase/DNA-binding CsgD family transcriptional regulator/tetratricopeptide (TPR) repeat protein